LGGTRLLSGAFRGGILWSWLVYWLIFGARQTYRYYVHYLASELRLERMERSFSHARLNARRMQLDPHFLFNALNTVFSQVALARAKVRHDERSIKEFGRSVLLMVSAKPLLGRCFDRLVVKSGGTTRFIRVVDIDWIEGAGVYVNLHVAGKELLYRAALNELADRLDPVRFVRVHRSAIVNIDSILELQTISRGEFELILKDGHRSRVSRTYRALLEKRLGQSL
jgi:LytTr DNA-binding domain/Histidine kinase